MRVFAAIALAVILVMLTAVAASAQSPPGCNGARVVNYADMARALDTKHHERRAAFEIIGPGSLWEMWASAPKDGPATYTLVLVMLVPTGKAACMVKAGQFQPAGPREPVQVGA